MSEKKEVATTSVFTELFQVGLYKRSQGKIVRQATFFAFLLMFVVAGWKLRPMFGWEAGTNGWTLFLVVSLIGAWISYRIVNIPRFADFLINVEGELNKISWPSQSELIKSSWVVIFVMLSLSLLLWFFDTIWFGLFSLIGVIEV